MLVVFLLHVAATLYMTGLIWFVQLVHYPLFSGVGAVEFLAYQQAHMRMTAVAVGPPMLMEIVGAAMLVWAPLPGLPRWSFWVGLVLVLVIWASTGLLQVPRHDALVTQGFDASIHTSLVATNWIRTIAWSARGVLVTWMLYALIPSNLP